MKESLAKYRVLWTRHAAKEVIEDNLSASEIEKSLSKCIMMESGAGKEKAVCKVGKEYCTLIFVRYKEAIKIITCWRSSGWEARLYMGAWER